MVGVLAVAHALTACDSLFDLAVVEVVPIDAAPPCAFQDGFDDGTIDLQRWSTAASAPEVSVFTEAGHVVLVPGAGLVPTGRYADIKARAPFDLAGWRFAARIVEGPNPATPLQAALFVRNGDNSAAHHVLLEGDRLVCGELRPGASYDNVCNTQIYDPAIHQFWAFSSDGSSFTYEVSADGADWVALVTRPFAVPLERWDLGVYAYMNGPGTDPGRVVLDDVSLCTVDPAL